MFICEKTTHCCDYEYADKITDIDKDARDCPHLVEVEKIIHARWINAYPDIESNSMLMYGICSNCGYEQSISNSLKYCPECGAKMDLK